MDSTSDNSSYRFTELRKLPPRFRVKLSQILDTNDDWKKLMSIIPAEGDRQKNKYKTEHIQLVEQHCFNSRKSCGEVLLDEWSTSGLVRPTVDFLYDLLQKCQLYRAADYVAEEILQTSLPKRPLEGPAKQISTAELRLPNQDLSFNVPNRNNDNVTNSNDTASTRLERSEQFDSSSLQKLLEQLHNYDYQKGNLINFSIDIIHTGTNNFNTACCIGSGAFGTVYKLDLGPRGFPLAIKLLHTTTTVIEEQFLTEIRVLSRYRHENLVSLVGFCTNGPQYCLIYEFMSNGTLQEAIACEKPEKLLSWPRRLSIMFGVAKGIHYLHSAFPKSLIHRDIKSANILLNEKLHPKIGDFGLAKSFSSAGFQTSALASTIFGTSAYMAPEAFRGDISPKIDIFSFGVVLLEILTGLAPYDETRDGNDIVTHLEDVVENDDIIPFVDPKPGQIHENCASNIYNIARKCISEKRRRPTSDVLLHDFQSLMHSFELLTGKNFFL